MKLQESGEMYLETILVLSEKSRYVRSIDIAEHMNYSKPSVSRAMKTLRENGYLEVDGNGFITLTETGLSVAEKIYERHHILSQALVTLGVPADVAVEDACRIEHVISDKSFQAIKKKISG